LLVAERTREYELVMILSPEATEEEIAATVERVDGLITGSGGGVAGHDTWGMKRLAFPLANHREGNYILTRFTLGSGAVLELSRNLNASEDILRFLVTRT
jgi:small subunit ribosomal protein S6